MLIELGLPSCNTVMHNAKVTFASRFFSAQTVLCKLSAVQHQCNLRFNRSECFCVLHTLRYVCVCVCVFTVLIVCVMGPLWSDLNK